MTNIASTREGTARRVAASAFRGERVTSQEMPLGLVQVAAAMFVAAVPSLPVVLLSDVRAQEATGDVPAVIIGAVAYLLARRTGKARLAAGFYAMTALLLGVLVALVKVKLAAH